MLPSYYTTTSTKKRKKKKKSKSLLEAERQHAKFLKKMGVSETKQSKPKRSLAQSGSAPVWEQGVRGSNPLTPTNSIILQWQRRKRTCIRALRLSVLPRCINLMQYQFVVRSKQQRLLT